MFLGDFAFKRAGEDNVKKWLNLLNGHKTFLKGNHDGCNNINTKIEALIVSIGKRMVWCTHNPRDYNPDYEINLVGHVHSKWRIQRRGRNILVNVGVDVWNYAPVSIDEILKAVSMFKRKGIKGRNDI